MLSDKIEKTIVANIYVGLRELYTAHIFDYEYAYSICQEYVDEVGLCVSFTKTDYIYSKGNEPGLIIGIINYPRFPSTIKDITDRALELAQRLKDKLLQHRVTVIINDYTYMLGT